MVGEAVARGKHLLIRTDGDLTIHTHLKMEGSWRVRPVAEPLADSYKIRLLLANSEWQAAGYSLGITEVLPTSQEHRVTGHLGPDLLGPDWDAEQAAARLAVPPDRPIGEALLDQRNLAGIGTWFLAEMLFLRGIDPARPAGSVDDLNALVGSGTGSLRRTRHGPGTRRPGTPGAGRRAGCTGGQDGPAGAAEHRSGKASRGRRAKSGSASGARTANGNHLAACGYPFAADQAQSAQQAGRPAGPDRPSRPAFP